MGCGGWGVRLLWAIGGGCVPLLASSEVASWFDDALDYSSFSLRGVPKEQLPSLPAHLAALGTARLEALQRELLRHRPLFLWGEAGHAYDVTLLLPRPERPRLACHAEDVGEDRVDRATRSTSVVASSGAAQLRRRRAAPTRPDERRAFAPLDPDLRGKGPHAVGPHVDGVVEDRGTVTNFIDKRPELARHLGVVHEWSRAVLVVDEPQRHSNIELRVRRGEAGQACQALGGVPCVALPPGPGQLC